MDYVPTNNAEPDQMLTLIKEPNFDGLEFVQFYIFVKDGDSKYINEKVTIYQIYEDMCL